MEDLWEEFDEKLEKLNKEVDELQDELYDLREQIDFYLKKNDYPNEEADREIEVL